MSDPHPAAARAHAPRTTTLRDAAAADADDVFSLLTEFATSHRPDRAAFDRGTFPRALDAAAHGRAEFLVAEDDGGRVVGYLFAARLPTLFAGGTILEILELAVTAPLRGRGTGSALVRAAEARARAAADVELTVPTRRAAGFYRTLGFQETAVLLKRPTA